MRLSERLFGWIGGDGIPPEYDLARLGWDRVELAVSPGQAALPLLLADPALAARLHTRRERAPITLIGVEDPVERARLLALGYGEVLSRAVSLAELEERVARVAAMLDSLPRRRAHGRLALDLLLREGWVGERRLGLHPREFALLWRLAETPGEAVAPEALLSDVWQLHFRPETNSLAVHVCRLRAKLASAGISDLVRTTPRGSYVLTPDPEARALPLPAGSPLSAHVIRAGNDEAVAADEKVSPEA
jgi:DNA-binding response OmpR family regulator